MTITRKLTSITTAAALAFTALAPAANAGGYKGDYDRGYGQSQKYNGYGNGYGKGYGNGYGYNKGGRDYDRDYAYRHHKKRDNTGKYIALGIGALMLGIIASGASRH